MEAQPVHAAQATEARTVACQHFGRDALRGIGLSLVHIPATVEAEQSDANARRGARHRAVPDIGTPNDDRSGRSLDGLEQRQIDGLGWCRRTAKMVTAIDKTGGTIFAA